MRTYYLRDLEKRITCPEGWQLCACGAVQGYLELKIEKECGTEECLKRRAVRELQKKQALDFHQMEIGASAEWGTWADIAAAQLQKAYDINWKVSLDAGKKVTRDKAKQQNFSLLYGSSGAKLQASLQARRLP